MPVSYLRLLTPSTASAEPALLFVYEKCQLLINVPEGLQRWSVGSPFRLSKITHILLTQAAVSALGGLPGTYLTMADAGRRAFDITGPAGIAAYMRAARLFIHRPDTHMQITECRGEPSVHAMDDVQVQAIPLVDEDPAVTAERDPLPPRKLSMLFPQRSVTLAQGGGKSPLNITDALPPVPQGNSMLAYVLRTPEVRGKFLAARARALGVPPGPMFGQLTKGLPVQLPDGRTVQPAEVVEPPCPAAGVVVLPCPNLRCLPLLRSSDKLQAALACHSTAAVVHLAPREVWQADGYQQWLASLPAGPRHISSVPPHDHGDGVQYEASTRYSVLHHALQPHVFPLPWPLQPPGSGQAWSLPRDTFTAGPVAPLPVVPAAGAGIAAPGKRRSHAPPASEDEELEVPPQHVPMQALPRTQLHILPEARRGMIDTSGCMSRAAVLTNIQDTMQRVLSAPAMAPYVPIVEAVHGAEAIGRASATPGARAASPAASLDEHSSGSAPSPVAPAPGTASPSSAPCDIPPPPPAIPEALRAGTREFGGLLAGKLVPCGPLPSTVSLSWLGTGSALPSQYRNVTGQYLWTGHGGVLLDGGEGTYHQLVRLFGPPGSRHSAGRGAKPADAGMAVDKLALVWISHLHADHHLGLPRLILQRPTAAPPLVVVGPYGLATWLSELSAIQPALAGRWAFIPSATFAVLPSWTPHSLAHASGECERENRCDAPEPAIIAYGQTLAERNMPAFRRALADTGLSSLMCAPVEHCHDSWVVRLQADPAPGKRKPWSVVFSGDCIPCPSVAALAHRASLLVHEATLEDALEEDAAMKKHCTMSQALSVAQLAGAHATAVTHFSARYPRLPDVPVTHNVRKLMLAADMMCVAGSQVNTMPHLEPALRAAASVFSTSEEASTVSSMV